ncbi:hypothetical protein [Streptomyces sp. NBC_00564]|uniref:hypothetical protein n=1 Tax=Streptomyces sp. NBC_00564 TaxID=2903663 RepID=UPI00352F9834|nr:hypothetical protein OG256_35705 [Streptomyces sp. NBC_00564]
MTYRFLPFVRRGLAARLATPDQLTGNIPARAKFAVRLALNHGGSAQVDVRVHGPGDVIGVDPRVIVRTDPVRLSRDFPPNQLALLEFDAPDLPWMFTPAAAAGDRIRPWLVLVVVKAQPGVEITVRRDRPLPQLVIEAPAVPADELPDLAESWAWAHAHVVEEAPPTSVPDHLAQNPDLNVARLLCPRRLEDNTDYIAALVPAFESGRLAGLGQQVPDAATTAPAWGGAGGVGATVTLPTYFHWNFRTGPDGDFEQLARRLVPRPVPDTVGRRRMSIAAAHPALPRLPGAAQIVELEGALRAPGAGSGTALTPAHATWVARLTKILDAPADHVVQGASRGAEDVAPPIYGGRHVQAERLAGTPHRWLTELNTDPRHRATAGLGIEAVRLNQEAWVHAAWEQVGDVLAANALLDRARFLQQVLDRVHRRHVLPLPEDALLAFTATVHARVLHGERALSRQVVRSTVPAGALGVGFRRMLSPRSKVLVRAARAAELRDVRSVPVAVVGELAQGERAFDLLGAVPDGLVSSRLLDRVGRAPRGEVGAEIGAVGRVPATLVRQLADIAREVAAGPAELPVRLRPNLAKTGVLLTEHLSAIGAVADVVGLTGTAASAGMTSTVSGLAATILAMSVAQPGAAGFALEPRRRGAKLTAVVTPPVGRGAARGAAVRAEIGVTDARVRALPDVPVVTMPRDGNLVGGQIFRTPNVPVPVKDGTVVRNFVAAFEAQRKAIELTPVSVIPPPSKLDLVAAHRTLVVATNPHDVVTARARLAVRIGAAAIHQGLAGRFAQLTPLDPVMAAPVIGEPLYRPLAKADPDRFLPGIGLIPDDTLTLLETNPRFVEAFMVGANHEMNRELLWRGYPTDRRGTPFRRFWDRVDGDPDIPPIHEFRTAAALGTNGAANQRGTLVLLVRGQLLRRFPHTVIYAAPARFDGTFDTSPTVIKEPIFWGQVDPDVTFAGFELTRQDVEPAPGWYFVLAEQPTAPRFGLDAGASGALATWSDLTWDHVGVGEGEHLTLAAGGLGGTARRIVGGGPSATFGRTSADMAAITFQRPFRAVVHTAEVFEGMAGGGLAGLRPVLTKARILRPIVP